LKKRLPHLFLVLADGDQSPAAEPGFHEDPPQRGGSGVTAIRRYPDHLPKLREQQPKNHINASPANHCGA
jgi:hypothetical protein